jgi:hypothetical protein
MYIAAATVAAARVSVNDNRATTDSYKRFKRIPCSLMPL